MDIITGTSDFQLHNTPSAVAIGKFDGVHLGHQRLLQVLMAQKRQGLKTVIFTFDPSPAELFSGKMIPGLSTREEKRRIFEKAGVDVVLEFPLTKESAAMAPEDFVREILCEKLCAECIVAGADVSFGAGGRGDISLLQHMAPKLGYSIRVVEKVTVENAVVSSTRIRQAVEKGAMEEVASLLGTPYSIGGKVVHGKQLGRTLSMPTINVPIPAEKLVPPFGVYYSEVQILGEHNENAPAVSDNKSPERSEVRSFHGITNIGKKPTVGDYEVGAETFLYDFAGDLYGKEVKVELLSFRRPERKFETLDDLQAQLMEDKDAGRVFFDTAIRQKKTPFCK